MEPTQPPDEDLYQVIYEPKSPLGLSPYRLRDPKGEEVHDVNEFLDAQATRGLSVRSLRTYSYSLLSFWRWHSRRRQDLTRLKETDLLEYVRFQQRQKSASCPPAPRSLNCRLSAVRLLYRFHTGSEIPSGRRAISTQRFSFHSSAASDQGYLHPSRPKRSLFWIREPRRIVVPLTAADVAAFLESFRSRRDLTITGLMLLCGLRSRELIELKLDDVNIDEGQLRVHGKGNRERVLPLPRQIVGVLRTYLEVERPPTRAEELFVSLKGKKRGSPLTAAGLRSLFRHHRATSGVRQANPHRFRHTFGADMVRAGISLPALMKLMGHAHIQTTLLYVELSPKDVFEEFYRVAEKRQRLEFRTKDE